MLFTMKNTGVRYGLLGGVAVVCYFALLYFIKKEWFLNVWLYWASMGIYLLLMWRAAKEDCAEKGVSRDFREILRTPFVVFLLVNLFFWLFYYALHLADPSLLQMEMAMELNGLKAQIEAGTGDPQQANILRERIAELEKLVQSPQIQPLGPILTRMCIGALGGFAISAAIAVILRSGR